MKNMRCLFFLVNLEVTPFVVSDLEDVKLVIN